MPKTDKTTAITGDSVYKMAKAYAKKAGEQHVTGCMYGRHPRPADPAGELGLTAVVTKC